MSIRQNLLLLTAIILLIAGPSMITFTSFEWRGVIGWGLTTLGLVLMIAWAAQRSRSKHR